MVVTTRFGRHRTITLFRRPRRPFTVRQVQTTRGVITVAQRTSSVTEEHKTLGGAVSEFARTSRTDPAWWKPPRGISNTVVRNVFEMYGNCVWYCAFRNVAHGNDGNYVAASFLKKRKIVLCNVGWFSKSMNAHHESFWRSTILRKLFLMAFPVRVLQLCGSSGVRFSVNRRHSYVGDQ